MIMLLRCGFFGGQFMIRLHLNIGSRVVLLLCIIGNPFCLVFACDWLLALSFTSNSLFFHSFFACNW